jgi:hypothetical protein
MGVTFGVQVEIGELVLDGFDHGVDADLVSAAFSAELARLVELRGVPAAAALRDVDALADLPAMDCATSADRLGVALARSVHAGLSGASLVSGVSRRGNETEGHHLRRRRR